MYPTTDHPVEAPPVPQPLTRLTPRERELVTCIQRGLSNREIAQELHIAEQTVKNHLSGLYSKLEVKGRLQLLIKMMRLD
jgi:DNA-binding NarL/FixJ family response regulator